MNSIPIVLAATLAVAAACQGPSVVGESAGATAAPALREPGAIALRADADREPFTVAVPGAGGATIEFLPLPPAGPGDPPLWMARTELTWDCYGPWLFRFDVPEDERTDVDASSRPSKPYGAVDRGFGYEGHPVIGMTAAAASQYGPWLASHVGGAFRLPTEAEWERACRADADPLEDGVSAVAWTFDDALDRTHPVASKAPNAWGFYDLLGNVAEWCTTPEGGYVVRGGSFNDFASEVGPGLRQLQTPAWNRTDPQQPKSPWWLSDAPFVGLRLVCTTPPPPPAGDGPSAPAAPDEERP